MARVAPVNLPYNIRTLWFDPAGVDVHVDDKVVVNTARGLEMGVVASDVMEVSEEEIQKLKSPLRPIERIATDEDIEKAEEMERLSQEAMPIFKELARENDENMHPVCVQYLLDGDKAIFYFEAEERIDFRDLVRKLASKFHVRIDMRQIGVRDEARIVGGLAHCGQVVCCKRLGGEFKQVSIRMAKDQDLSLNPQKISGLCGRLMCCLRYENEAYKDFKSRSPKVGAMVQTPEGEGKVVEVDVPKELIFVRIGDEKPVKIPLSGFEEPKEGEKPSVVGPDAWEHAKESATFAMGDPNSIFQLPAFTGEDKLGGATAVHHESSKKEPKQGGSRKRRGSQRKQDGGAESEAKRSPRRRSTTIKAGSDERETSKSDGPKRDSTSNPKQSRKLRPGHKSSGLAHGEQGSAKGERGEKKHASGSSASDGSGSKGASRRRGSRGRGRQQDKAKQPQKDVKQTQGSNAGAGQKAESAGDDKPKASRRRVRRRRSSKGDGSQGSKSPSGSEGKGE